MQRWRITYSKLAAIQYTSNLDMHRIWERALRRAGVPVAYSQGFHPQPHIQQACPLPLGFTSQAELLDIWLESETTSEDLLCAIVPSLPAGIQIRSIEGIDPGAPAMQTQIAASLFVIEFLDPITYEEVTNLLEGLFQQDEISRIRRGKQYDLRPLIFKGEVVQDASVQLKLWLSTREGQTGRPDEVLLAMGLDPYATHIHRLALLTEADVAKL